MTPRIGVLVPSFRDTPADALTIAQEAERLGIDGVFVYDHLWPPGQPDRPAIAPFPVLGAIAAITSVVRLGTLVARVGIVPDDLLVAEFAALAALAPQRVVAALGTGDHLSFEENLAFGLPVGTAEERRGSAGACARALISLGLDVWIGGASRRTTALAEEIGAIANLWQASPKSVAAQATRSEVTWAGMARRDAGGVPDAPAIAARSRPLVEAGASWLVFGWPVDLAELAAAARVIRSG